MKIYKWLLAAICILLACSICACSGEILDQGGSGHGSGQLGTNAPAGTDSTGGHAGSLNPGNTFQGAEHLLDIRVLNKEGEEIELSQIGEDDNTPTFSSLEDVERAVDAKAEASDEDAEDSEDAEAYDEAFDEDEIDEEEYVYDESEGAGDDFDEE